MSLSYRRANRASWCLGYDSSSSSSSSGIGSRPLSSYSSISSSSSRLDYGGSSGYGSSSRRDYRSSASDVHSTRTGLYPSTSSVSSRSSGSYGDSALKRSSYSGVSSYGSSGSVRDLARRESRDNTDSSSSLTSTDRRRKVSDTQSDFRSRRDSDGNRVRSDVGSTDAVSTSTRRRASRRGSGEEDNERAAAETSGVESYVRRRNRRRYDQEESVTNDTKDVSSATREGKSYESQESRLKSDSVASKESNIEKLSDKGSVFDKKLASYVKDCDDKSAASFEKTADSDPKVGKSKDEEENGEVFEEEEQIELKPVAVSFVSGRSQDVSVKYCKPQTVASLQTAKDTKVDSSKSLQSNNEDVGSQKPFQQKTIPTSFTKHQALRDVGSSVDSPRPKIAPSAVSNQNSFAKEGDSSLKGSKSDTSTGHLSKVQGREEDQARKPRVNGTAKSVIASTNNARSSSSTTSTTNAAQKEIVRLESLCEARTKELTHTKMQLKATTQGFDAMAVLVNYCCAELNAFECPTLAKKLEVVQKQLTDCLSQIADLSAQKESLDQNLTQVTQEKDEATKRAEEALSAAEKQKEEHAKLTHELDDTHNAALTTQRDELTSKHAEEQNKIRQYYDKQIDLIKHAHDRQMSDLKNEHKLEINGMKISHLEEIQELRNKHDDQMEELHKQHRNKLEDITHRFESIKLTLSEKVESLRGECDEMTRRARCSEEALQRDADVKVQIALAPYLNLPKEIESLKTVVEMRNEEIQKLRSKNMDLEKQLEELPIAKEKIISLQQKVENLEAIINIKTDHEKQLHEKCQVLMRKYDRESRANKRLSMDYEQVMWRMSQSSEFGSCESLTKRHFSRSPPRSEASSPDPRRRNLSPNDAANGEVVMRVKKRNSHSLSEDDRKLRSRSATFVVEKENSESRSPSSSPQLKQKRWRKKSQTEELAAQDQAERMCHSAGAELMSEIASQQHKVVEQLKSEMTDSQDSSSSCVAMASSYARSLSGVSDSGVYDSMTRSELNSSMVSTDSEFGTSVNLSMNLDSTMDEYESGPQAGDYNSITDTTVIPGKGSSSTSDSGNVNCGSVSGDSVTNGVSTASSDNNTSTDHGDSKNCSNYEFQVSLPDGTTDDNVFDDSYSLDSPNTTSDSITFVEANVSDSELTSATAATENVDTAVSSPHTVTDVQDTSSPQDSSTKSS